MPWRRIPVAAAFLGGIFAARALALEGPTLSRYAVHVSGAGPLNANLDQATVETLCKDEDGCEVSLEIEGGVEPGHFFLSREERLRLALQPAHGSWSDGNAGATTGIDGNGAVEDVASLGDGGGNVICGFDDGDGANDDGVGFSLTLSGPQAATAQCSLVLID
jgi:hypothetical protein